MKYVFIVLLSLFLFASCVTTNTLADFYMPIDHAPDMTVLNEYDTPNVIYSANAVDEAKKLIDYENYTALGVSTWNGPMEKPKTLKKTIMKYCKENGIKAALWSVEFAETKTGTLTLPTTQETDFYGSYFGSGTRYGSYRGKITTTGTTTTTYNVDRYNYVVVYLNLRSLKK